MTKFNEHGANRGGSMLSDAAPTDPKCKGDNVVGKVYPRPWGSYQTLALADGYQVKILTINPMGKLSLQKHQHRSEHWVVVKGQPTITVAEVTKIYQINDKVYIPAGAAHRIENLENEAAVVVEVQIGEYLGEDDIIRLHDIYGRVDV